MILIMLTILVSVAGVGVNMYIVFHILTSQYKKTIFDLGKYYYNHCIYC